MPNKKRHWTQKSCAIALNVSQLKPSILFIPLLILTVSGCGWDNGLPSDLPSHLDRQGISIIVSRAHAPVTRRDGFLVSQYDAETASKIISAFKLARCKADEVYLMVGSSKSP